MTAPAPARRPPSRPGRADRGRPRPAGVASLLLVLSPALAAGPACAQIAASATVESDYRVRGVSFSDGQPAASLTVAFDDPSGVYLGATGVVGETSRWGLRALGYQADLGYAVRTPSGLVWDAGVSTARFTEYFTRRYDLNYSELYAGIARGNVSAHLYYSPDYLGQHVATLYGEVDGVVRPSRRWRLFAHAGLLTPLGAPAGSDFDKSQYDLRVGAALELKACELRLAWTTVQAHAYYPDDHGLPRHAVVFSASHAF